MTRTGHVYTPQKTISYENLVKTIYMDKCGVLLSGPLKMTIWVYFKIPKSASQSKKEGMISGSIRPVKRPDGDNILKIVADSVNSIAYDDDSQIVSATVEKWYAEQPRVDVLIEELS